MRCQFGESGGGNQCFGHLFVYLRTPAIRDFACSGSKKTSDLKYLSRLSQGVLKEVQCTGWAYLECQLGYCPGRCLQELAKNETLNAIYAIEFVDKNLSMLMEVCKARAVGYQYTGRHQREVRMI